MLVYNTGYSEDEIQQVKKSLHFRNTSYIWNICHFNASKNVGKCSKAAQDYYKKCLKENKQSSIEDYEEYYFENVISYKDFVENSRKFKNKLKDSGVSITYELAFFYQWIRVIYDSYKGIAEKEFNILNEIRQKGSVAEHTDEETDRKYAIDLLALNNMGCFEGIQIKPISFLNGVKAKKEDILNDCKTCLNGQEKWLSIAGNEKVVWYFYDKENLITKDFNEVKEIYECNSNRQ